MPRKAKPVSPDPQSFSKETMKIRVICNKCNNTQICANGENKCRKCGCTSLTFVKFIRRETMNEVNCETCPITQKCCAYREARADNELSYHPQNVVRVSSNECPLASLIKGLHPDPCKLCKKEGE